MSEQLPFPAKITCSEEKEIDAHQKDYSFFEIPVHLASNTEDFFFHFDLFFGKFQTSSAGDAGPHFQIWISDKVGNLFGEHRLYQDGELIYRTYDYMDMFLFLEWQICGMITKSDQYLLIHAGLATLNGEGILVTGPSGAGKTTLIGGLALMDYDYITDEMVVVDPTNGKILPFPRTLNLEEEAFTGSPKLLKRLKNRCFGRKRPYFGNRWFVNTTTSGQRINRIKAILLPRYDPEAKPTISEISHGKGLFLLMQNTFNLSLFQEQGIDLLIDISKDSLFFKLTTGNLEETLDLLERTVQM